jgi:leucyl aminopeptidase
MPCQAVAAAVQAVADATYLYTHTKSQAKPIALTKLVLGVVQDGAVTAAFNTAVAQQEA